MHFAHNWDEFRPNLIVSSLLLLTCCSSSYKDVLELGGYASRVHQMFAVFSDCAQGNFTRMQASEIKHALTFV
jgi:hypothetical protein